MKNILLPDPGRRMMSYIFGWERCRLLLLLILLFAVVSACSNSKKHETVYLQSKMLMPLKIPPGLEAPRTNNLMIIPDAPPAQDEGGSAAQLMPDDGREIDAPPEVLLKEE